MGRSGPRPKPTALKRLEGKPKKKRNEPKPTADGLRVPGHLDKDAKLCWSRIVPQLKKLGVATKIDRDSLEIYCTTFSQFRQYQRTIRKEGPVQKIFNEDGSLKYAQERPEIRLAKNAADLMLKIQREFGMTPSSRSTIDLPAGAGESDLDAFMRQGFELRRGAG